MKKNKKILMIGTAITSIVAPLATVISCGSRNTNHNVNHSAINKTPNGSHGTFHTSIVNNYIVLNIKNYKQYTTYEQSTGALIIKEGINEISDVFQNGYILDPTKPTNVEPIKSLTLPSTLEKIDNNAFVNVQLTDLTIPDNVTTIGEFAFYASQLTDLTIPNSVITIRDGAFLTSKLLTLNLGTSLETIGDAAFWHSKLRSLTIPNSVTSIGDWAFCDSKLTILTIPGSVYNIGKSTFEHIFNNLSTHVTMPIIFNNNADKDSIFGDWDQITFTYIPSQLIVLNLSNYKQYTTYDQSTGALTIEDDVVEITDVFRNGYIPDPSKPNDTVQINSLTLPSTLKKIDDNAFQNAQLLDLTIPNNVTTIGDNAFYYSSLTNLTLGTSLLIIGNSAFFSSRLIDLTIPNNVTSIGNYAFTMSTLKTLIIPDYSVTSIGIYAFYNSQLINLSIPIGVISIGEYAFYNSQLINLSIPGSVTSIGEYAFYNSQLINLSIPYSLRSIGIYAFYNSKLRSLTIPDSVTSIGIGAFGKIVNNSNTKVTMPAWFNSDSDKDKIFGWYNWERITFDWI